MLGVATLVRSENRGVSEGQVEGRRCFDPVLRCTQRALRLCERVIH